MLSSRVLLLVPLLVVTMEACSSKKSVDTVAEPETTAEPAAAGIVDIDMTKLILLDSLLQEVDILFFWKEFETWSGNKEFIDIV